MSYRLLCTAALVVWSPWNSNCSGKTAAPKESLQPCPPEITYEIPDFGDVIPCRNVVTLAVFFNNMKHAHRHYQFKSQVLCIFTMIQVMSGFTSKPVCFINSEIESVLMTLVNGKRC
jgi:hypothetical protein